MEDLMGHKRWWQERTKLEAERDRYRRALQDIVAIDTDTPSECGDVDHYGGLDMQEIASEALKEEDDEVAE